MSHHEFFFLAFTSHPHLQVTCALKEEIIYTQTGKSKKARAIILEPPWPHPQHCPLPTVLQCLATTPALRMFQASSVQSSYLKSSFWPSQAHPKLS